MPQSFACVYLHVVFSTKNRTPQIDAELAPRLYEYLGGVIRGNTGRLVAVGGMPDHVHLVVSMGREITIADSVRTAKVGASRWVHDTFPDRPGFGWQNGYGAFGVSASALDRVI